MGLKSGWRAGKSAASRKYRDGPATLQSRVAGLNGFRAAGRAKGNPGLGVRTFRLELQGGDFSVERAGPDASRPLRIFISFSDSLPIPADASGAYRPHPQATTKFVPDSPSLKGYDGPVKSPGAWDGRRREYCQACRWVPGWRRFAQTRHGHGRSRPHAGRYQGLYGRQYPPPAPILHRLDRHGMTLPFKARTFILTGEDDFLNPRR